MSDEKTPAPGDKAQLAQDRAEVQRLLKTTEDQQRAAAWRTAWAPAPGDYVPSPLLPQPRAGKRTSFEAHELNAMIDLVDSANPADLETAGQALWRARDALKSAAQELEDHIKAVDWQGKGGTSFRNFGRGLVTHARSLSDFADTAGTQITVAGTGLASVYKAMPPRDDRFVQTKVDDIPLPASFEGNPAYVAAKKVEEDRQEAINQMNRLSSFYAVSEQTLAAQQPPHFDQILKANVPPPTGGGGGTPGAAVGGGSAAELGMSGAVAPADTTRPGEVANPGAGRTEAVGNAGPVGSETARPGAVAGAVAPAPGGDASMELARTAAPPAPAPTTGTAPPPITTSAPAPPLGTPPPMAPGYAPPVQGGAKRAPGMPGTPVGRATATGQSPTGRAAAPGQSPMGRAAAPGQSPMGRAAAPGQSPMGRAGAPGQSPMGRAGAPGQSPMGRAGAPGQTPMGRAGTPGQSPMGRAGAPGQTPMGRTGAPGQSPMGRAGRTDGITGGNPQRTTPGSSGSRVPRGTVVGGEPGTSGRSSAGRFPSGGAVGASPAGGATARPTGRPASSTNGVVGTPRSGATPATRPGTGGFTQGGAGLVRGPAGQRNPNEREEQRGSERPDYLTEDEETWTAGRRSAVPPVID